MVMVVMVLVVPVVVIVAGDVGVGGDGCRTNVPVVYIEQCINP